EAIAQARRTGRAEHAARRRAGFAHVTGQLPHHAMGVSFSLRLLAGGDGFARTTNQKSHSIATARRWLALRTWQRTAGRFGPGRRFCPRHLREPGGDTASLRPYYR